jgi:hypothetical protein
MELINSEFTSTGELSLEFQYHTSTPHHPRSLPESVVAAMMVSCIATFALFHSFFDRISYVCGHPFFAVELLIFY